MKRASRNTASDPGFLVSRLRRPSTRIAIAVGLLIVSLSVLLVVALGATGRLSEQSSGVRISGRVTGYDTEIQGSSRGGTYTAYLMKFTYLNPADGRIYNARWQVPDQSWTQTLPTGTQIMVSYPLGSPGSGYPVGEPFDSAVAGETIAFIVVGAFTFLILIVIAIAILRGVWRERTAVAQDSVEDM